MSEVAALHAAAPVRTAGASARQAELATPESIVGPPVARLHLAAWDFAVLVLELAGLWGINKVGYLLVAQLRVSLPGNVAGMLLLFGLLCSGVVPVRLFQRSSALLARHLPFFFVPIAVGLMNLVGTFMSQGWELLLILIASAAVGLCVTGWLAQVLSRLKSQP